MLLPLADEESAEDENEEDDDDNDNNADTWQSIVQCRSRILCIEFTMMFQMIICRYDPLAANK